MSTMTPERLSELRERWSRTQDCQEEWRIAEELFDAVEALQAELAEESKERFAEQTEANLWAKRSREAEDIANLAMRVGREMYSDAQYWRERHCLASALNAEQSQKNWQRAEKAERDCAAARAARHTATREEADLRARLAECVSALEALTDNTGDEAAWHTACRALAAAKSTP